MSAAPVPSLVTSFPRSFPPLPLPLVVNPLAQRLFQGALILFQLVSEMLRGGARRGRGGRSGHVDTDDARRRAGGRREGRRSRELPHGLLHQARQGKARLIATAMCGRGGMRIRVSQRLVAMRHRVQFWSSKTHTRPPSQPRSLYGELSMEHTLDNYHNY